MQLDSRTFEVIYPKSYTDASFEQFEFMLMWIGRRGETYQWLFENWSESTSTQTIPVNYVNSGTVRSIITDELATVTLLAENVNRNELDVLKSAKVASECFRLYKNGTIQRLAVVSQTTEHQQLNRFNFAITVQIPRVALAR